ncbi:MAG TPA: hypothetical protein VJC15_01180 [Candidatus Paceibacterota bacterium]
MMNARFLSGVLVAVLVGGVGGWFFANRQSFSPGAPSSVASASKRLTLPENAEMYIPCIKGHGAHYSEPQNIAAGSTSRPWVGPSYIVREDTGAVIGIEYHVSAAAIDQESNKIADLVGKIVGGDPSIKLLYEHKFPVLGANYDSMDIFYIAGHPGFEVPHYDIHAWTLPKSEHAGIDCPTAS